MDRGHIRNAAFAWQPVLFRELRWGSITPTNIDVFAEFSDRLFVFVECKHGDSMPPRGQVLALERLIDAIHGRNGRKAVLFQASHESEGEIEAGQCRVTRYYYNGKWKPMPGTVTVREAIDRMRQEALSTRQ